MGNRGGRLHNVDKTLTKRRWTTKAWIACRLKFKDRQREIMGPKNYTELFFLDEATAFAAGHRPCAECRRRDFNNFMTLWNICRGLQGRAYVKPVDSVLHEERIKPAHRKRSYSANLKGLPDGTFILLNDKPYLILENAIFLWTPDGYEGPCTSQDRKRVQVLTPKSMVEVFRAGYQPQIHNSVISQF